jgi:hypothetical protein
VSGHAARLFSPPPLLLLSLRLHAGDINSPDFERAPAACKRARKRECTNAREILLSSNITKLRGELARSFSTASSVAGVSETIS